MRVSSVCSADYGLRCGAVRWVNKSRLSRMHLTKIFGGQKRQAGGRQGHSGAAETNCSTDPGVYRSATVTAPSRLSVRRGVLFWASASALLLSSGESLFCPQNVPNPQTICCIQAISPACRQADIDKYVLQGQETGELRGFHGYLAT